MAHQSDSHWLGVAAQQSLIPFSVKRNPRVGAVIVDKTGLPIASGFHEGFGTAHAEQVALAKAKSKAKQATIFVNLAPCNHVGKTPSCCEAIIDSGIKRVVYSNVDPNPVSQGNIEFLRANGVEVHHQKAPKKYEKINERWFKSFELNRPFVTAKIAMTMDAKTSGINGKRLQITGVETELEVHQIRNGCDAILTGTGTVLVDNPKLNVRYPRKIRQNYQPLRFVAGDREVPSNYFVHDGSPAAIFVAKKAPELILEELFKYEVRTVLLESGPTLMTEFMQKDLIDEIVIYLAPSLIGQGRAIFDEMIHPVLNRTYNISSVELVGRDLRIRVSLR